ncbi:NAD-dependent epimerase/dehydratase family protein [Congregicoccus parvus]|uniref:NAD-dependent epimerase/dehydratase family protein n=1 Tax=Congregicoccus parvus TaxID=3081749 RepID=UPI003FA5BE15
MSRARPLDDDAIETLLSEPPPDVVEAVKGVAGDFLVLGVGGKMGTSLARMLRRAVDAAGTGARVIGVSRFGRVDARAALERHGIETIACDLADPAAVAALPEAANVFFLAGQKFGTDAAPEQTWLQNTIVPAYAAERFRASRFVVFSTGCVYPFVAVDGPGADEETPLALLGEYAATCVGRERVFTRFSKRHGTSVLLFRLNYAVELRYGVLVDIAARVLVGEPVDVSTGHLNLIWQGDAVARAIRCLPLASSPPCALNVTGGDILRVRDLAEGFARRFGRDVQIVGDEAPTAWLADARRSIDLFGSPTVPLERIMDLVAEHLLAGGALLGKPTHFEARDGRF